MQYIANLFSGHLSWIDIVIRVASAVLVGMFIGIERELSNHPAGMKTHALVCLGAALTSMISSEMGYFFMTGAVTEGTKVDVSRIASGVVSGIGFIGAGAIIKSKDGSVVTGITTAATVWISGCMGLAIGMGYFRVAVISLLAIVFATVTLKWMEYKFIKHRGIRYIEVITDDKGAALPQLEDYFDRKQILITSFDCTLVNEDDEDSNRFCCRYFLRIPKSVPFNIVMRDIAKMEEVIEVYESTSASSSSKKSVHSQV